jgi:hypothetical protein
MSVTPAVGLVSGKIPGNRNGKAVLLSYQGMLFPGDMLLESGGYVRGAGIAAGSEADTGTVKIQNR